MRALTLPKNVGAAAVLALVGAGLWSFGSVILGPAPGFKLAVGTTCTLYAGYIMWCCQPRIGRLVVPLLWVGGSALCLLLDSLLTFATIQACMISVLRGLYLHTTIPALLLDLVLSLASVGFALWGLGDGNFVLAFWCFYLVQGLAVFIPGKTGPGSGHNDQTHRQTFCAAAATARQAFKQITLQQK